MNGDLTAGGIRGATGILRRCGELRALWSPAKHDCASAIGIDDSDGGGTRAGHGARGPPAVPMARGCTGCSVVQSQREARSRA